MKRTICSIATAMILFLLLPVAAGAAECLIPVGQIIGLQLSDDSVTVAAYDDTLGSFARESGLKIGDEIICIDGHTIDSTEDVRIALADCAKNVELTIRRSGKTGTLSLCPIKTGSSSRLGVYLRQGIAGIGTVTWYDPESGMFGTLGHGVSDSSGKLLNMRSGAAYSAQILSVKKGLRGEPGQLKGSADTADAIAKLQRNTPCGVFGIAARGWQGEAIPVAASHEVSTGAAVIRSTVTGSTPREYSVEIMKIYPTDRGGGRNLLLQITDPELLAVTGGIVQGMSGSPIIQNGKLVGAVTHVLVNDPTRGYGIFIENMLDAAA